MVGRSCLSSWLLVPFCRAEAPRGRNSRLALGWPVLDCPRPLSFPLAQHSAFRIRCVLRVRLVFFLGSSPSEWHHSVPRRPHIASWCPHETVLCRYFKNWKEERPTHTTEVGTSCLAAWSIILDILVIHILLTTDFWPVRNVTNPPLDERNQKWWHMWYMLLSEATRNSSEWQLNWWLAINICAIWRCPDLPSQAPNVQL